MENEYLEQKDIPDRYPFLKKNTIIELKKAGKFPPGKKISEKITVWSTDELNEWLNERDFR